MLNAGVPPVQQVPTPEQLAADKTGQDDLPALDNAGSLPGPGTSALATALKESYKGSPPKFSHSPGRSGSPALSVQPERGRTNYGSFRQQYGSFGARSFGNEGSQPSSYMPQEDPEIIKRHLVLPQDASRKDSPSRDTGLHATEDDEFSSLQLQGGDITRQVYRWTEDAESQANGGRQQRSRSFDLSRPDPESETLNINSIKMPGGFRRNYIRRAVEESPGPSNGGADARRGMGDRRRTEPNMPTSNFLEFLTLYGHFAGEELEEDDEVLGPDEYFAADPWADSEIESDGEDREPMENSALLTPGRRRRKPKERSTGTTTSTGAAMLLLKSFVGTGVLFLPKAFLNGGMVFSSAVLIAVSLLSFWCFILLVQSRQVINGSFGDIGGALYGRKMRNLILSSIVLSQIGFVAAYIVFTSENLQAFILAVSKCKSFIDIKWMVLMQLVVFLPLSLIRDISKLGFTALIADAFILIGLIYLYYADIETIVSNHGPADISNFNPSTWTLFIGTAIFTYEGVGLIIPIQESMKRPEKFPGVLAGVMVGITVIFVSAGAISYAAFGSTTKTVILLNLPQDSKFVNAVQFLYSLAILLSTPLQLFPAIRIMENELFTRSGKYNPGIKWKKNGFRFCLVVFCAMVAWLGAGDLDKFVSIVGSFACVPLVYVYPVSLIQSHSMNNGRKS